MNPSDHIGDIMDMDADAREELNAEIDADDSRLDDSFDDDFDPSGGYTEDDFPIEDDNDYDNYGYGTLEAEAEAWHGQYDY